MTRLLGAVRSGDGEALNRLVSLVYEDLRMLARRELGRERRPRSIQATALVHEAYGKLAAGGALPASDRAHFLAIAARAMRQVLVDQARRRSAARRGGGWVRTTLGHGAGSVELDPDALLELDRALDELAERERKVVELRFFGGLEEEEIAAALDVSARTVRRDWMKARARLYRRLYITEAKGDGPDVQGREGPR